MFKSLVILIISIVLIFIGFKFFDMYQHENVKFEMNKEILETVESKACAKFGGKIQHVCMSGRAACIINNFDAGMKCNSSKDCQGRCITQGKDDRYLDLNSDVQGYCEQTNHPCSCLGIVEGGRLSVRVCHD